jgi:hypothetical protein
MKTILLIFFSSGPHSMVDGPKLICSCTPWKQGCSLPGGVRLVSYMDHTGCHRLNSVLTHNNNVDNVG